MKARSVVFTHIQWPFTVFGLPPKLMILSLGAGAASYVLSILFEAIAISVIAFAVTIAASLALSYRLARSDRHVETLFLASLDFWRFSSRRWLLAGVFPQRSPKRGRS